MNNSFINKVSALAVDNEIVIQCGDLGIDINQPLALPDILFRKTGRFVDYSELDLPFEIVHYGEVVNFFAYKETYTLLGLALFELLFSDQSYIEFQIGHAQSQIKQLFFHRYQEQRDVFCN